MITIADLIKYRMRNESLVKRVANAKLPTEYGDFRVHALRKPGRSTDARRAGLRRDRRRRGRAGPRALAVPDRRRVPFGPLRLRRAARSGDGADRRGRARHPALPESGRARHRPRPTRSAPTSCRTKGSTRSRRTSGSASRPINATTAWASRFCASSASARCG